jgi:hypothetical protein
MCATGLGDERYAAAAAVARDRLIDDHHDPEYFFTHFNAGHNAVATHVISGALCALVFGEETAHPLSEQLVRWGEDACRAHLHWGFDEDGAPHEGCWAVRPVRGAAPPGGCRTGGRRNAAARAAGHQRIR